MRKILGLAVCFVLLSAAVAHAEMKIAVFDLQTVANKCDAVKDAQNTMKKKFDGQKAQLEKERTGLEKKMESFKGKPTEQQQAEFVKMQRDYSEKANAYVRAVQAEELRIRQEIDVVVLDASKAYAKQNGYNLILDSNSALYFDDAMNVTNDMLTEVNKVWRAKKK